MHVCLHSTYFMHGALAGMHCAFPCCSFPPAPQLGGPPLPGVSVGLACVMSIKKYTAITAS